MAIRAVVAKHPGQKVKIFSNLLDTEASRYAQDFITLFTEGGWKCAPIDNSYINTDVYNARVVVKSSTLEKAPKAALDLQAVFIENGVSPDEGTLYFAERLQDGEVGLMIGAKPPTPLPPTPKP